MTYESFAFLVISVAIATTFVVVVIIIIILLLTTTLMVLVARRPEPEGWRDPEGSGGEEEKEPLGNRGFDLREYLGNAGEIRYDVGPQTEFGMIK